MAEAPSERFVTEFEDSRRWRNVLRRPGDVVICAPRGPAATWTQQVVPSMLSGARLEARPCPWIDDTSVPLDLLVDQLQAETSRRCLLTRSPADCIPFDESCSYIVAVSPGREGLQSRSEVAGESAARHLRSWWNRRHSANVLFVHHVDITTSAATEVARIAEFLDLVMTDSLQILVGSQYQLSADHGPLANAASLALAEQRSLRNAEELRVDAAAWLEQGSVALGQRPAEIGEAPAATLDTDAFHPVFGRLAKHRPSNSIDAITDRRVDEAREAGLFDNLVLHGEPIPDLDRRRRPGWWANQFVAKERNKVTAIELEAELRSAMPAIWRLGTETQVQAEVARLNDKVTTYNRVTTLQPMRLLSPSETLGTWRRLKHRKS